jgi:hypothetical protein
VQSLQIFSRESPIRKYRYAQHCEDFAIAKISFDRASGAAEQLNGGAIARSIPHLFIRRSIARLIE